MFVYPLKSINNLADNFLVKFVFSKKATKFDEIFTVDLTLTTYCQINGKDFFNFCGLLLKHELYVCSIENDEEIFPYYPRPTVYKTGYSSMEFVRILSLQMIL